MMSDQTPSSLVATAASIREEVLKRKGNTPFRKAKEKDLHPKAMRDAIAMSLMPHQKRVAYWSALVQYVNEMRLLDRNSFPVDGDHDEVEAEQLPDLSSLPVPPLPVALTARVNSKRLTAAWRKGVEARRQHRSKHDHYLFGLESIEWFGRGWDAMDRLVVAELRERAA